MTVNRRTFLKTGGAAAGTLAAAQFLGPALLDGGDTANASLPATQLAEEFVNTTCWIGKQDCGMVARKIDGRVVKFEGHPANPRNVGRLCPKGVGQIQAVYDPNRVKAPLRRTNAKGQTGTWAQISWDEALTLVAEKMNEARRKDPRLLIWQKGRSKAKDFYDEAFVKASGATKLHHGAYCSDAGYRALEYTTGFHGVLHPDFRYTRYLLSFGWNLTSAGGNKFCNIVWNQQLNQARERGIKVVNLDPSRRSMGPFDDLWLPIRPGTDLAFFLALANVLVGNDYIDRQYLVRHTNSPFLVKDDGLFLRIDGKEQVWDEAANGPRPYDGASSAVALEGSFSVGGQRVRTAFELFKQHVATRTPEWAAAITDLPAGAIRRVGLEMGENALIGSTITIDGVEIPYRPVGIMAYHVSQQELGFAALRMATMVSMLLGSFEAVGGTRSDTGRALHKNFEAFEDLKVGDAPFNIYLKDSKFFPINSNNSSIVAHAMNEPKKWGVDYTPEVCIIHMANPVIAFPDQKHIMDSYAKFKFVAVIDPWLSETADYYADVVLPAATIEKYEGPISIDDGYMTGKTLRMPPMEPLFDSLGDIDIYLRLCEKAGIIDAYLDVLNTQLKLKDPYKLAAGTRGLTAKVILDRWAKSAGYEGGIEFFERNGAAAKPIPAEDNYAAVWGESRGGPHGGVRHRLYGESLLRAQTEMKAKGVGQFFWRQYTPFPTWLRPTMEGSPAGYDLYLTSRKMIEFKQSRSTFIPILNELAPRQGLEINPKTAKARGIKNGDEITVESHNAVTGETRQVRTRAVYLESIRPDTVCLPHHYGFWVSPITKDQGPTANALFFSGEGYVSNTADQSFHVKVRVEKA